VIASTASTSKAVKVTGACLAAVLGSFDRVLAMRRSNKGRPVVGSRQTSSPSRTTFARAARDSRRSQLGKAAV
jgi:hypothetical protein